MVGLSLPQVEDSINKIRAINPIPARIDALNDLAWVLRYSHKDQAYLLCREACELSQTGAFNDQPYRKGLGTGLVILGIIDLARNKLDNALDQSIRALATLHQLPPIPAVVDAWLTICWIYQFLGEFPTAFDYALMALKLARELGSKEREAYALDALGSTYGFSAEYKNSIESHEQALRIFRELGNVQAEAMALNNMACSLLDMGDYSDAYPASQKSLELAQRLGFFEEELAFTSTIADILVKLGDYEQAGRYLQQAFNKTRDRNLEATQASLLVSMARLRLAQKNYAAAEPCLTQALAVGSPVVVKWTYSATDQTGFTVQRSTSNTFPANSTTTTTVGNVLTYSDTSVVVGLKKNTTYYYRVTPTNGFGSGAPSNTASLLVHP